MDWPGSPLAPFIPGGPLGPAEPGSPGTPRSPLMPIAPWGPIGPCFPGGPGLPRRPALPFGPEWQSVSSLAQIWFCSRRSSCLISSFTSKAVWTDCCESSGEARFRLDQMALSP